MIAGYDRVFYDTLLNEFVKQVKNAIQTKNISRYTKRKGSFSAPVQNTDRLIQSIRINATDEELQVLCAGHVLTLIFGRKPGTMPPTAPIAEWLSAIGSDGSAFAVARSMQLYGSSIWQAHQGQPSELFADVDITQALDACKKALAMSNLTQIKSDLIEQFKNI